MLFMQWVLVAVASGGVFTWVYRQHTRRLLEAAVVRDLAVKRRVRARYDRNVVTSK